MTQISTRLAAALMSLAMLSACAPGEGESPAGGASPTTAGATAASPAAAAEGANPAATLEQVNQAAGKTVKVGDRLRIETTKGSFEVVVFPEAAPKSAANFVALAKKGFYDGTTFHRVIPGFVAQGGDPLSKTLPAGDPKIGTGGAEQNVPGEMSNGLKHLRGSLAMARSQDPDSASSQFYVCFQPLPSLDTGYTVFGHVVSGMDVVDKLNPTERDGSPVTEPGPDKMVKVTVL